METRLEKFGLETWSHPKPSLNEAIHKKRDSGYMHLVTLTRQAEIQLVT